MYSSRFQELMTEGYALSNKLYFKEFNQHEFNKWIDDCELLLAKCEPEPDGFPWCPDPRHIEEIVMLLSETSSKISKGEITYIGIF